MKKLLLCITSLMSVAGFSQSSLELKNTSNSMTLVPNATVTAVTQVTDVTTITFDVKNTSGSTQSYEIVRYDLTLNPGGGTPASAYFCFASYCYGDNVYTSPNPITLNAGQSASQLSGQFNMLVTDLAEGNTVGYSQVKYSVRNISNAADSVQFTIRYNETMGVNELQKAITAVDLFPNPATENISVKVNAVKATDARVVVYNALGAVVTEKNVALTEGKNKIEMNVEAFAAGIYFANIKAGNNTITKKFIVK